MGEISVGGAVDSARASTGTGSRRRVSELGSESVAA
jgi:hypothetical protein